jgi:ornithine carbamoyltransferase
MGVRESFRGIDILTLQELSYEQIGFLIGLARDMKERSSRYEGLLKGKVLAMIFEKPSTRTRISFEVAMYRLGGYALNLRWDEAHSLGDKLRLYLYRPYCIRLEAYYIHYYRHLHMLA